MKKISKEKRIHLALVAVATVGLVAGLWFFLINNQKKEIVDAGKKIEAARADLEKIQKVVRSADQIEGDLKAASSKLDAIEKNMSSGDIFSWTVQTLKRFNEPSYKVDMPQISTPTVGDMPMLPGFPYSQSTVSVSGSAYFWDLGRFVADFENHFPYMRIQNLELTPIGGDEREKLAFHMNIICLVKPQ